MPSAADHANTDLDALQAQAEASAANEIAWAKTAQSATAALGRTRKRAEAAEAERDQLRDVLRPFVEDYDFHAAAHLAERVDGEEARVFTARTVESLIEHQRVARAALAGEDKP